MVGERIQREREKVDCPTDPFTILETQNPGIAELYLFGTVDPQILRLLNCEKVGWVLD